MLRQQKRHSQQISNTKKPIRPIQLTLSKRNSNVNLLTQSSTYGHENVLVNNNSNKHNKKGINISSSGSCYNQQKQKQKQKQKQNSNVKKNVALTMILSLGARIRKPLMEGSVNVILGRVNENNRKNFKKEDKLTDSNYNKIYKNRNSQSQQQYSHPIQQDNEHNNYFSNTNYNMTQSVHIQPLTSQSMMITRQSQQNTIDKNINICADGQYKSDSLVTKTIRPVRIVQSVKYQCQQQRQAHQQQQQQPTRCKQKQEYNQISVDSLLIMGSKLQQLLQKVNVINSNNDNFNDNDHIKQPNPYKEKDHPSRQQHQHQQQPTTTTTQIEPTITTFNNNNNNIQHYQTLQQRLQLCLQQLHELQSLNSTQRILQLQSQIAMLKQTHHQQQSKLIGKVKQLQGQLQKGNCQKHAKQLRQQQLLRQQQFSKLLSTCPNSQQNGLQNNPSSTIITTAQSHYHTTNTTIPRQTIMNDSQHSFYYQLEILKRKYTTLQRLLQTKKSQILNKDHVIKLLLKQKVQNIINPNKDKNNNKNIIIDSLVDQMFSLMQSRLCSR